MTVGRPEHHASVIHCTNADFAAVEEQIATLLLGVTARFKQVDPLIQDYCLRDVDVFLHVKLMFYVILM